MITNVSHMCGSAYTVESHRIRILEMKRVDWFDLHVSGFRQIHSSLANLQVGVQGRETIVLGGMPFFPAFFLADPLQVL